MKKMIMLGVFLLLASVQSVCAQVSDIEKKQVEEQIVLVLKKYEGLGLTTEQLAEKVAADLLAQARALQDDVALDEDEEKSNSKKKWIIGAVAVVAVCGIGYWVYKTYFAKSSLEKAWEELIKAAGGKIPNEMGVMDGVREQAKKDPRLAEALAIEISKVAATVGNKSQDEIMHALEMAHVNVAVAKIVRETGQNEASVRAEFMKDLAVKDLFNH